MIHNPMTAVDDQPDPINQAVREMGVLAQLRHVHIVLLYGYTVPPDSPADLLLVFERMETTLEALLPVIAAAAADKAAVLRLTAAEQIAQAMAFLHDRQILHRDLCPANVLSAKSGENGLEPSTLHLKLADFGFARVAEQQQPQPQQQRQQMTVGIMRQGYSAPELVDGDGRYSKAVDAFAFAHLLRALWQPQGRADDEAFEGKSAAEVARLVYIEHHRPAIGSSCPAIVVALIKQGWAAEPAERPSFDEMHRSIDKLRGQHVAQIQTSTPASTEDGAQQSEAFRAEAADLANTDDWSESGVNSEAVNQIV